MNQYKTRITQPIVAAAANEMGKSIEDLLAHGANANTLERQAHSILQHPSNSQYQSGESVLDMVQKKLKVLRKYEGEHINMPQKEPEHLRDEKFYTRGLVEGSYHYWTAVHNYQSVKRTNAQDHVNYQKSLEKKSIDGEKEKKEAIAKLIRELESAEKALVAAGAKTFAQLHPDLPKRQNNNHRNQYTPSDPLPYETKLNFQIPDLNDTTRIGYQIIFEAAWSNDIDTIKSLTLALWDDPHVLTGPQTSGVSLKTRNSPLKVAVRDGNSFSPFSIAVLRGHRDLARKIIDICIAQYHKDDGLTTRQRGNMLPSHSDDGESDDGEHLPIFSELVSDRFTVENLGEVSNFVKSNVMPLQMIEWGCMARRFSASTQIDDHQVTLWEHALHTEDMSLFKFMIELGSEQQALLAEGDDDQKSYTMGGNAFQTAIKLGRTDMLAYMIKTTGSGIPLNELIKKSGVELKTQPRYYQGLTGKVNFHTKLLRSS